MLEFSWGKMAFRIYVRQWLWEGDNVGERAAETMRRNVADAIMQIRQMPDSGRFYKRVGRKTYRIVQTHPKSALLYWYDEREVHIVRFIISYRNKYSG
ncbi:MAG: hypothetical protein IJ692_05875 [Alloprevotella sp.]|nr:hypothetical protein [Alloprevotella sp.]